MVRLKEKRGPKEELGLRKQKKEENRKGDAQILFH